MLVLWGIYVLIFLASLFITLKFMWGKEGKDERGRAISNTATMAAFGFIPIGWLLLELFNRHIQHLTYSEYKWCIWVLITGSFIVLGVTIFVQKRKY